MSLLRDILYESPGYIVKITGKHIFKTFPVQNHIEHDGKRYAVLCVFDGTLYGKGTGKWPGFTPTQDKAKISRTSKPAEALADRIKTIQNKAIEYDDVAYILHHGRVASDGKALELVKAGKNILTATEARKLMAKIKIKIIPVT